MTHVLDRSFDHRTARIQSPDRQSVSFVDGWGMNSEEWKSAAIGGITTSRLVREPYSVKIGESLIIRDTVANKWSLEIRPDAAPSTATVTELFPAPPPYLEDLKWLRSSLGVSMSEISELFGVTRKAVYDWFNGSPPKREGRIAKIHLVRSALEAALPPARLRFVRQIWELPLSDGGSLLEQLKRSQTPGQGIESISLSLRLLETKLQEIEDRNARPNETGLGEAHAEDLIRSL